MASVTKRPVSKNVYFLTRWNWCQVKQEAATPKSLFVIALVARRVHTLHGK